MSVTLLSGQDVRSELERTTIVLDISFDHGRSDSCRIFGSVPDALEQLSASCFQDVVACIEGCDWMLARGGTPGAIDVLCDHRRLAVLQVSPDH